MFIKQTRRKVSDSSEYDINDKDVVGNESDFDKQQGTIVTSRAKSRGGKFTAKAVRVYSFQALYITPPASSPPLLHELYTGVTMFNNLTRQLVIMRRQQVCDQYNGLIDEMFDPFTAAMLNSLSEDFFVDWISKYTPLVVQQVLLSGPHTVENVLRLPGLQPQDRMENGVYQLVTTPRDLQDFTGGIYTGSASGDEGFQQRWMAYDRVENCADTEQESSDTTTSPMFQHAKDIDTALHARPLLICSRSEFRLLVYFAEAFMMDFCGTVERDA